MVRFRTTIEAEGPNGAWAMVAIPRSVSRAFPARERVPVAGTINGYAFRTSVMPRADGSYYMMVNKAMRAGAGAGPGDTVVVELDRDAHAAEVVVPGELRQALDADEDGRVRFDALPESRRKEYAEWVAAAKQPATRARRAAKVLSLLAESDRRKC